VTAVLLESWEADRFGSHASAQCLHSRARCLWRLCRLFERGRISNQS